MQTATLRTEGEMSALTAASRAALTVLLLVSHLPLAEVLPGPAALMVTTTPSGCTCGPDCACTGGCCDHKSQRHQTSQHRRTSPDAAGRLQARTATLTRDGCGCSSPALLLLSTFRHDLAIVAAGVVFGLQAPSLRRPSQHPAATASKETRSESGPRGPPSSP